MNTVSVVGSLNVDNVIRLKKLPKPGQTLHGLSYGKFAGGKGLNQAVALTKLGTKVILFGKVGLDTDGKFLRKELVRENIVDNYIGECKDIPTGKAFILLDEEGNNEIVVIHGANNEIDREYIEQNKKEIFKANLIVLQFEIPVSTVLFIIDLANKNNVPLVVNPSPYYPLNDQHLYKINYLVLNEVEAGLFLNRTIKTKKQATSALQMLKNKGVKNVIITLGKNGAAFVDENNRWGYQPAFQISAVDTTASGDAFLGGLINGLLDNRSLNDSVVFGNAAGALAASKMGALPSLPNIEELMNFLEAKK